MDAAFTFSKERKEFNIFEYIFYKIYKIFREVLWCYYDILRSKYGIQILDFHPMEIMMEITGFQLLKIKTKQERIFLLEITMSVAKLVL